jgi:hypothetical protein
MKLWLIVVIAVFSAVVGYILHFEISSGKNVSIHYSKLSQAQLAVQKNIRQLSDEIEEKLTSFADAVSEDRVFSLRLLGEQDRSSSDVTQFAARFIKPMGFSLLDIIDSSFTVVSSGQFTANAGSNVSEKSSALGKSPEFLKDNIMGESALTFQARKSFKIADIPFFVSGGYRVDKRFIEKLAPDDSCTMFLKIGNEIYGNDTIRSVSELKGHTMIINDKQYDAIVVPLASGAKISPQVVVFYKK